MSPPMSFNRDTRELRTIPDWFRLVRSPCIRFLPWCSSVSRLVRELDRSRFLMILPRQSSNMIAVAPAQPDAGTIKKSLVRSLPFA